MQMSPLGPIVTLRQFTSTWHQNLLEIQDFASGTQHRDADNINIGSGGEVTTKTMNEKYV